MLGSIVTPMSPIDQGMQVNDYTQVADVYLHYADGREAIKIIIKHTGHNPAAVSLDGTSYYYARTDDFPDGATRIIRLLQEYDYSARHGKR
jgi:hypothetical protein